VLDDFRSGFRADGSGEAYDEGQYAPGSYWDVVWQIEKRILGEVVGALRQSKGRISYLDFACGTGRVLSHLEGSCDESSGIDISEAMLAQARKRVKQSTLVCRDITEEVEQTDERYDLITAFRFLLNAEPALRERGLRALASRLRDRDSRLVVNCHGSLASYKALLAPWRALRSRVTGQPRESLLWPFTARRLLRGAGLEVVETFGTGILPGAVLRRIPAEKRVSVERWLGAFTPLARLGVNQIYVCRLAVR
jgi:SAM-dependent methyltransferase